MNKRNFIKRLLIASGLAAAPTILTAEDKMKGKFVHTVLFWLKNDTNLADFIAGTRGFLDKVKVVKSYHVGTPAMTPREVVNNSYSVCLVVTFKNKADQDIYQEHPAHLAYVEERKNSWDKVVIYDSLEYPS
ncbi:MAG: Dabb family protein [Cyclobacteriaceae bacterium]